MRAGKTAVALTLLSCLLPASARAQFNEQTLKTLRESLAGIRSRAGRMSGGQRGGRKILEERLRESTFVDILLNGANSPYPTGVVQQIHDGRSEWAFFERVIRPTLPSQPPPHVRQLLEWLRPHLPLLDPETVFWVPQGHAMDFVERRTGRRSGGYVLDLVDDRSREHPRLFLMDRTTDWLRNAEILAHEYQHLGQISVFGLSSRLERVTGVPREFLAGFCISLTEGHAQDRARLTLGRALLDHGNPLSPLLREALRSGPGELSDAEAERALETRVIGGHRYYGKLVAAVRRISAAAGPEALDAALLRGDFGPLSRSWTKDRKEAISRLAALARTYRGLEDGSPTIFIPPQLRQDLEEHIAAALDPSRPYASGDARRVVESHLQGEPCRDGIGSGKEPASQ